MVEIIDVDLYVYKSDVVYKVRLDVNDCVGIVNEIIYLFDG